MESEIPFPCPCGEESPRFDTQHEVATLIAEYQAQGRIKKCAHVHIERFDHVLDRTSTYGPGCRKDSFDLRGDPYGGFRVRYFYGCPKDCRLYYPAWRGSAEKWIGGRWWHIRRGLVGIAQWYASLSPFAQVILAFAVLALVGSPWRDTILEGLRVIFGK